MAVEQTPFMRLTSGLRALGPTVGLYMVVVALVGFVVDGGALSVLLNLYLLRIGYGPEQIDFLRYRPVLDNRRLKEVFGYVPMKTSAEAFHVFAEAQRDRD